MKKTGLIWSVVLWILLAGCAPHADEPDGLALVRVLGVDGGDEVTLTAVCTVQGQQEPVRGEAAGRDFVQARERLPWSGDREMALTSLSFLVVGEEADLEAVLTAILNDQELSPAALVWCTEDAEELLEESRDPVGRLELLLEQGETAPTAAEALAELKTFGTVELPALKLAGENVELKGVLRWNAAG